MSDSEAEGDALPADLDVTAFVGPYTFPDNARRRVQGVIYLVTAVALLLLWLTRGDAGVLVNGGFAVVGVGLLVLGAYCLATASSLKIRELDALVVAVKEVGFPVGHASAQMAWRGLRSTPVWRILLYSADEPPSKRGLVALDGRNGEVIGSIVEDNPEVWEKSEP